MLHCITICIIIVIILLLPLQVVNCQYNYCFADSLQFLDLFALSFHLVTPINRKKRFKFILSNLILLAYVFKFMTSVMDT